MRHWVSRTDRSRLVVFLLIFAAGCAPTAHRLMPYRDDPSQARQLESRAFDLCWDHRGHSVMPEHHFTTDGCSMWPDGPWVDCCVSHDIAYWCSGNAEDRLAADKELQKCANDASFSPMGTLMLLGVRLGGGPRLHTPPMP